MFRSQLFIHLNFYLFINLIFIYLLNYFTYQRFLEFIHLNSLFIHLNFLLFI